MGHERSGLWIAEGDGSLQNAEYTIKYYDNQTATGTPKATWVFKTDKDGKLFYSPAYKVSGPDLYIDASGIASLPIGTITIQETKQPTGYLINSEIKTIRFTLQSDGTVRSDCGVWNTTNECEDLSVTSDEMPIIGGSVSFKKADGETKGAAQGVATLEGAKINIINAGDAAVTVNGKSYAKNAVIMTLTTDKDGKCSCAEGLLPYGTYKAVESSPSKGYLLNSDWSVTFQIREDGVNVDTSSTSDKVSASDEKSGWTAATGNDLGAGILPEYIQRADFALTKLDEDGNTMANIPFLVERLDADGNAVESHVIVTDENGYLNTAERSTSDSKVNSLDSYEKNGVFTDESKLDPTVGIRFGVSEVASGSQGALIYANYRITELKCKANEGLDLLTKEIFTVNDPGTQYIDGKTYVMTAFVNLPVTLESDVIDVHSNTNIMTLDDSVSVSDTVKYENLKINSTYRMKTELFCKDRAGSAPVSLGSTCTEFTPAASRSTSTAAGTITNTLNVRTSDLEGGTIYAVDTLCKVYSGREVEISLHNDDDSEDRQRLYVPYLETRARDGKTNDHVGTVGEEESVIDNVLYENLADGRAYQFEGVLRYADTGEIVKDVSGNNCVVTKNVSCSWAETAVTERYGTTMIPRSGSFDMPAFTIDSSELGNRTLVVTETIRDVETGETIIQHYDLGDEAQSVHYVKVTTTATDTKTGSHTGFVGATTVTDRVVLENLIVGQTYTIGGDLVCKTDCTDANGTSHKKGDVIAARDAVTFTATAATMTQDLTYTFDSSILQGISGVVFESLTHNDIEVASHKDYDSAAQTVSYPSITTTAVDKESTTHTGIPSTGAAVKDTVVLKNLTVGEPYYIVGTLMNEDGTVYKVNGDPVTKTSETFTADTADKTLLMEFPIDSTILKGQSLVVYEKLYYASGDGAKEVEVNREEDKTNLNQTVDYPFITTDARDGKTADHVGTVGSAETVIDQITYKNLTNGSTYLFTGTLRYTDTDEAVKDADGNDMVVTRTITCSRTAAEVVEYDGVWFGPRDGVFDMPAFTIDSSELGSRTVVVTETLTEVSTAKVLIDHSDITDEAQSIHYVKVTTTAADTSTSARTAVVGSTTITDKVVLENLIVGQSYTVGGDLVCKTDCTDANGTSHKKGDVIATRDDITFTATAETMTQDLTYTVDASALAGISGVVFEAVTHNKVEAASHHDYEAESQTTSWPSVATTAVDKVTGTHTGFVGQDDEIIDKVEVKNLTAGDSYYVAGTLMTKDGEIYLADGKTVTAKSEVFRADSADAILELSFVIDSSDLHGTSLVAYEKLFYVSEDGTKEVEVSRHEDKDDEAQTIDYPELATQAADGQTKDGAGAVGETTIIDTVTYKNLRVGDIYTLSGDLHYTEDCVDLDGKEHKAGDVLCDNSGKKITQTVTFEAEEKLGSVDLVYTVDSSLLQGISIVVFEELNADGVFVYAHEDIEDEDQRIDYPEVRTTALDSKTGEHMASGDGRTEIVDTVVLNNLTVGRTYRIRGSLMDAADGTPVIDADKTEVKAESAEFVATEKEMVMELTLTVKDQSILPGRTLVVYEDLIHNGITAVSHADRNDKDQSVIVPKIETTAVDASTEDHDGHIGKQITVKDRVDYTGLIAGKEYKVSGILMDKASGKEFRVNDQAVKAEKTFTAECSEGYEELTFTFESTDLAGLSLVAFETLTYKDVTVASHKDIDDEDQTVHFPSISTSASDKASGTKEMSLSASALLSDLVHYTGLTPGKTYKVCGEVMDKTTGLTTGITAETELVPQSSEGDIEIDFIIDTTSFQNKELVVFESLLDTGGNLIAAHRDINDYSQTVGVGLLPVAPKTGDADDVHKWFIAGIVSGTAAVGVIIFRRRRRRAGQ